MMPQRTRLTPHGILDYSRESNDVYNTGIEMFGQFGQVISQGFSQMANNGGFRVVLRTSKILCNEIDSKRPIRALTVTRP
jgi:hypothetical protein